MQKCWTSTLFLLSAFAAPLVISAQTPTKPAAISCSIRRTPMSPGDIAFANGDLPKALELYREEAKAATPEGDRTHAALIRALMRSGKLPEAAADATSWAKAMPKNSWSQTALGEVQWRQGNITEALATTQAVLQADFCNAQAHADYAKMLLETGMPASAQKQITFAHRLDPIDDAIEIDYIALQPHATQLAELTKYLPRAESLNDKRRKQLEAQKTFLTGDASPCRLTSTFAPVSLPMHPIQPGHERVVWGLEVFINGKMKRFQIDTTFTGLLLAKSSATGLDLAPDGYPFASGPFAGVSTYSSVVKSVKIGSLQFENCGVRVIDKVPQILEGSDGMIGGDVFRDFLLTLDFPGHIFKLDTLPALPDATGELALMTGKDSNEHLHDRFVAPSMATWTKALNIQELLVLPMRLSSGSTNFSIINTGNEKTILSAVAASKVTKLTDTPESTKSERLYTTGPINLDFAGLRYPVESLLAADISPFSDAAGLELGGILGTSIVHQLTLSLDYRDHLVNFTYDPNRITHCVLNVEKVDCF